LIENKKAQVVILSDAHYGHRLHHNKLWEHVLNWLIKEKDTWIITNGDLCETGTRYSYGLFDQIISPQQQMDDMIDYLEPLAKQGKIIGMIDGNHEARVTKNSSISPTKNMSRILGVDYFKSGLFLNCKVRKKGAKNAKKYTMYGTHGRSGAYRLSGKMNACRELDRACVADVYFLGHVHALLSWQEIVRVLKYKKLTDKVRHYIITGSYLKWEGSYIQEKGRAQSTSLGSPKVYFHNDTNRISVKT